MKPGESGGWKAELVKCFSSGSVLVHLIGVGNPIGRDDAVGLHVVSALRRRYGARPSATVRVHKPDLRPESTLSKLGGRGGSVVIFDAVECNREPGHLLCARLSDSRFGFFATHNIPLSLILGGNGGLAEAWVVGIQPGDIGVGEGLTEAVRRAAQFLEDSVGRLVEEGKHGPA